jgi:Holliday junction DNA helicase RuvA
MLAYLNGRIVAAMLGQIVVKLPAGMGYLVNVSTNKNYYQNEAVELFLWEVIRDDRTDLFGFESLDEKNWCEKLMKVSGVGPKSAANIVFSLGVSTIMDALRMGDPKAFAEVKGLGGKTAKKIILELKGATTDLVDMEGRMDSSSSFTSEFVDTLSGLGYKRGEIVSAISKLKKDKKWLENDIVETVRAGLKELGRG